MLKKYNNLEKMIIFVFVMSILIDNINGALMLYFGTSLVTMGQIVRILFVIFFGYLVIKNIKFKNKNQLVYIAGVIMLLMLPLIFWFSHGNVRGLYMDELYAIKLLYPILIILAMKSIIKNGKVSKHIILDIFKIYSALVPLTLVIPILLGLGFSSYDLGGGYKGFYYSNNEINVVLICTFIFCVENLYQKRSVKNLILVLLNLSALLLIGSKTSFIVFGMVLFVYLIKIMKNNPKEAVLYFLGVFVLLLITCLIFRNFLIQMLGRMGYYYSEFKKSGGSFIDFLTSGRSDRIYPALKKNIFDSSFGIMNLLLGIGRYSQIDDYDLATLMEMDYFDALNWYGIITATAIMIFYLSNFVKSFKIKQNFEFKVMFFLVMMFSFIAGHVWFSALAGSILSLVCIALDDSDGKEMNSQ